MVTRNWLCWCYSDVRKYPVIIFNFLQSVKIADVMYCFLLPGYAA